MAASGSMTFRVEPDLQAAFVAACKSNDVSAAQVLRAAMRDYLERNAQAALPFSKRAKPKS
jgi:hypothetical protein